MVRLNQCAAIISRQLLILLFSASSLASWAYSFGHYRHQAERRPLEEQITFYARLNPESNEYIARSGIFTHRPDAVATIVFLHGYGRDKFDFAGLALLITEKLFATTKKEYNTFVFDFRAHGESTAEQHSTLGFDEVNDVYGAIDFLRAQPDVKGKPLIAFALSMGAATTIEAQAQYQLFDALWLDTPFSSSEDVIKHGLDSLKFKFFGYEWDVPGRSFLERHAFNPYVQALLKWILKIAANFDSSRVETTVKPISPVESVRKITVPTFFVVCKNDEKVPVSAVQRIYENSHAVYKRLWIAMGRWHCDPVVYRPSMYIDMLNDFIGAIISQRYKREPATGVIEA